MENTKRYNQSYVGNDNKNKDWTSGIGMYVGYVVEMSNDLHDTLAYGGGHPRFSLFMLPYESIIFIFICTLFLFVSNY